MPIRPTMLATVADGRARPTAPSPRLTQWCAGVACGIALVVVAGWVLDLHWLAGQWGTYLPMPPSMALGLLLLGGGLFGQARWPACQWSRPVALAGASLAALLGLLVLVEFVSGHDSGLESTLARTHEMVGLVALGRMSPIAAASLLLESAALVLMLHLARWRVAAVLALVLAVLATVIHLVVLVGYFYGAPFLYGGLIRPVAFPAALAFVLLGVGQSHLLLPRVPALHAWQRGTMRGILVRAFLPAVFLYVVCDGWVDTWRVEVFRPANPVLWHALVALAISGLSVPIVAWVARRTGDEIEGAHLAVRESESRFRAYVEHVPDGMLVMNAAGFYQDTNAAACTLLGYSREELLHMHASQIVQTEALGALQSSIEALRRDGRYSGECSFVRKDGSLFVGLLSAVTIRESQYLGLIKDITERTRANQAMIASETRYRRLFEAAREGVLILDAETGAIVDVNPFLIELLGFPRESFLGMKLWDLGAFKDIIANQDSFAELQREEYVRYEDKPLEASDGRRIDVEFVSNVYLVNHHKVIQCNIRDITERTRADAALRESEERFRDVTFSMGDWVWEVDEKGVYTYCSRKGLEQLGDVIGKTPFDFMPPDEATRVASIFSHIVEARAPIKDLENWNITANGDSVCLLTNGVPILGADGKLKGYRGVYKNITSLKRAEKEKATLETQLWQAQKMESAGRLAGGVAHDFNNMLAVILGYAALAMKQLDPAGSPYADLRQILDAANRSADLTRQLLAFARKQTIAPRVLDLNDTVAGMLSMLRRLIGENIDVKWQPATDLWRINMDPSQIDQILANLCVNARDAIAGVGTMKIGTDNTTLDQGYCAAHEGAVPGEYVRLTVSDSGRGMDEDTLLHLFEPFFTTKAMGEGTGLGLATVYGAVKQNDGYIDVVSEPGQGTTFTIYFPRLVGAARHIQPEGRATTPPRGHETILLVEDEPSVLGLSRRMLESQGYTVLAASGPGEALRLAKAHMGEINLLVTDVIMPEMNGRSLAKRLLTRRPHLKCLFMSGYTADVIARHGVLDQGIQFLQKPFSLEGLASNVRDALDAQH